MEKKPPDPTKKTGPTEGARTPDDSFRGTTSPRHRFTSDGEKTTIMPLSEILKARDSALPATPAVDKFPEFSYQPTMRIALPAELQKKKVIEAQKGQSGPSHSEPPPEGPTAKTGPPGPPQLPPRPEPTSRTPPTAREPTSPSQPASSIAAPLPQMHTPMEPPAVPVAPSNLNQVIVFFSCKGGSGTTALSTNVSHYYAAEKKKTCLVDMDLQLGDSLAAMSLQPGLTIAKAMAEVQRGTHAGNLPLPKHATGVTVLSQVGSLDDLDTITSEGISQFVEGLRGSFDTIVVDGVRDFSDNVLAVLDMADKIAIVTVQEVLAIKRARWAFGILRKIGFDGRDITVVINRYHSDDMIPFSTLKQMFDPAPVYAVPDDGPLVLQSLNRGVPIQELSPAHSVTRNIKRLAKNLLGEETEEGEEATVVSKSSFWDRLKPGKRP